jgi:uncharacterized protein YjlB
MRSSIVLSVNEPRAGFVARADREAVPSPCRKEPAMPIRKTAPLTFAFEDDGTTPNNPRLPLLVYRDVIGEPGRDPAAIFEELFAAHGWGSSWRNGVYDFLHFHTTTHEVLGIARGEAEVQFGGDKGRALSVGAGDVLVLPAGTGHRRLSGSGDLLVVGAYPDNGSFDQRRPGQIDHREALARIGKVPNPAEDPVYGAGGPLVKLWA